MVVVCFSLVMADLWTDTCPRSHIYSNLWEYMCVRLIWANCPVRRLQRWLLQLIWATDGSYPDGL